MALDPRRHTDMALDPRRLREGAVGDLTDELAAEGVEVALAGEQVLGQEPFERGLDGGLGQPVALPDHDLGGEAGEAPAEDRGVVEHEALVGRQRVEAGGHEAPQRVGNAGAATLAQQRDQLLEEERVAAAAVEHELAQIVGDVDGEAVEQLARRLPVEGLEVHDELGVAGDRRIPPLEQARPGGGEHDDALVRRPLGHRIDELEHGVVGPVEVGQHDDHRPLLGPGVHVGHERPRDLFTGPGRVDRLERAGLAQ
jgi:hypothetical protein